MAEAVAGLSLAANILQMVEYGGVFVTTAWKIYSENTDTDILKDFKQLQYLAKDVDEVLGSLERDLPAFSATCMGSGDLHPELVRLAEECQKVTVEILDFVGKTGEQKSWKTRMHKVVRESFRLTWGQGKLVKLQTKLDGMRSQLILRLVHSLRCVYLLHSTVKFTRKSWEDIVDNVLLIVAPSHIIIDLMSFLSSGFAFASCLVIQAWQHAHYLLSSALAELTVDI